MPESRNRESAGESVQKASNADLIPRETLADGVGIDGDAHEWFPV
jgi:hypothetical protein